MIFVLQRASLADILTAKIDLYYYILKRNEPVLIPIGTNDPQGKGMK